MNENSKYEDWKRVYEDYPLEALPWELGRPRKVLVELIESGKIRKGRALDICCGAGTNTVSMALKGFEVTEMDIAPKAIEMAKGKAKKARVDIRFISGNAVHLPFKDKEFDFIFDMGCFHHILPEDREAFIKGVHRTLRVGGKYFLTCFSYKNGRA
ncbi:MAG: class I SAM-dependent methyltransferase [Nitrososphaerales archaeon]